jgi:hypothetical protein
MAVTGAVTVTSAESSAGCDAGVSDMRVLLMCAHRTAIVRLWVFALVAVRDWCRGDFGTIVRGVVIGVTLLFAGFDRKIHRPAPETADQESPFFPGSELVFPLTPAQNTVACNILPGHPPAFPVSDPSVCTDFQNHVTHLARHSIAHAATQSLHFSVQPDGNSVCGGVRGGR